jgi:uncharacterized protein YfaS (alpha-2-macroglobulin family)
MTIYQPGETLRINAAIVDADGAAVDPSAVVISITKPDGTLDVTEVAMTNAATGSFYYDYAIASDVGTYRITIKATGNASRITLEPSTFIVVSP